MNQCFYQSIARIPLGAAVAIEYLGPFLVAALGKRSCAPLRLRRLGADSACSPSRARAVGSTSRGSLFAAGSGLGWAAYVFASHRVGGRTRGFGGLAVSMSIAAVFTLPYVDGLVGAVVLAHPYLLGRLLLVAVMAIVLGFGAELQALRRLRPSIVSVLLRPRPGRGLRLGLLLLQSVDHRLGHRRDWRAWSSAGVGRHGYDAGQRAEPWRSLSVGWNGGDAANLRHPDLRVPDERARLRAPGRPAGGRRARGRRRATSSADVVIFNTCTHPRERRPQALQRPRAT